MNDRGILDGPRNWRSAKRRPNAHAEAPWPESSLADDLKRLSFAYCRNRPENLCCCPTRGLALRVEHGFRLRGKLGDPEVEEETVNLSTARSDVGHA
jgi:hypothetical protein